MTEEDMDQEDLDEDEEDELDNSELEAEFTKCVKDHTKEIDKQLDIAAKAIEKAEELSEKYGLPFRASVSPLGQSYFPTTFTDKFGDLDSDFVYELTGAYTEYYNEGSGWEHSSIC